MSNVQELAQRAKEAARMLKQVSGKSRAEALNRMADKLLACKEEVMAANAADLAAAPGLTDAFRKRLAISSFEEENIRRAGELFPELPRLLLVDLERKFGVFPTAEAALAYIRAIGCTGISFKASFAADRTFVDELRAGGLRVVCWGVSSDELGLAMAEIGVDAMTCNHAVALRRKYREKNKEFSL